MPYGEGYTDKELEEQQRRYAATDDDATYVVTHLDGTTFKVSGINSAKVVAGKDGTYRRSDD